MVAGGVGVIGLLLALAVALLGGDSTVILQQFSQGPPDSGVVIGSPRERPAEQDQLADFVSVVLADTEDTWTEEFRERGGVYRAPKLVLFDGVVRSTCGMAKGGGVLPLPE